MLPGLTRNPHLLLEVFDRLNIGCIIFEFTDDLSSFYNKEQNDISLLDLKDQLSCTVANKILRDTLQINPNKKSYTLKDWLLDFPEARKHLEICEVESEVKYTMFFERLGKRGAWIEGEYFLKFDGLGEFQGLMGIFRDVTMEKKLEKKVAVEKSKLEYAELILDISQKLAKIGTWRIDLKSKNLTIADNLCQLCDFPPGLSNHYDIFLNSIHEEDVDHFKSTVTHAFQTGSSYTVQFRMIRKGGEVLYISGNGHPIRSEHGEVVGYFGLSQDITALKNAQIELELANKNLELKVAERTHELEISSQKMLAMLNQLQLQNDLLQQYTYIVSHNLRAPIANLAGLSELFDFDKTNSKENQEILTHIYKVSKHLDHIIKDLNEILSAEGQIEKAKVKINIKDEIDRVCQELNTEIVNLDTELKITLISEPHIEGVRSYIFSILYNLIGNALKYRHPERRPFIEIGFKVKEGGYSLWVKDNGIGIDLEANSEMLFKPRSRLYNGNTRGMGMGLFLVKTHVDHLDGEIFVESVKGEGSKFEIYFPF